VPVINNDDIPYEIAQPESDPKKRKEYWKIGFGLQEIDGLKPSEFALDIAYQQSNGQIKMDDALARLSERYRNKPNDSSREADISGARISAYLQEPGFSFSPVALLSIHKQVAAGFLDNPDDEGKFRTIPIGKPEHVLGGATVQYAHPRDIEPLLNQIFAKEESVLWDSSTTDEEIVEQAIKFLSRIWQVHPFVEANTRTCVTFVLCYLRANGLEIDNSRFAEHSQYLRDALVLDNTLTRRGGDKVPLMLFTKSLTDNQVDLPNLREQYPR